MQDPGKKALQIRCFSQKENFLFQKFPSTFCSCHFHVDILLTQAKCRRKIPSTCYGQKQNVCTSDIIPIEINIYLTDISMFYKPLQGVYNCAVRTTSLNKELFLITRTRKTFSSCNCSTRLHIQSLKTRLPNECILLVNFDTNKLPHETYKHLRDKYQKMERSETSQINVNCKLHHFILFMQGPRGLF